MLFSIEFLAWL